MNTLNLYDLIENILEENFGQEISKFGKDLCVFGASTIPDLIKRQSSTFINVRNSLIILLQNKLVNSEEITKKRELKNSNIQQEDLKEIYYEFDIDNCLMRLRFPKILFNIKSVFGEVGQNIIEEFMQFGILSSTQCIEQVAKKLNFAKQNDLNSIKLVFVKMIESNYITQTINTKISDKYNEPSSKSKEKKNKKKKKTVELDKMIVDSEEKLEETANKKTSLLEVEIIPDDHILLFNKDKEKPYYFFINYSKVINSMKCDLIVDLVSQKINTQAGFLISIMLKSSGEREYKNGKSNPISIEEILRLTPVKYGLKSKVILELIDYMKKDENNYVFEWGLNESGQTTYCVNLEYISFLIKTKTLEKVIEQQFNANHVRIYRLLSKCGPIDLKNIMDVCLMQQKECGACLNQMIQENYVEFQEINKIILFSVNTKNNIELIVAKIYKIIFNLRIRLKNELEKLKNKEFTSKNEEFINKVYGTIAELDNTIIVLKNL